MNKCLCGSEYFEDRLINGNKGCPACDPDLGPTPEIRIKNYKILIGTPVPNEILDLFRKT